MHCMSRRNMLRLYILNVAVQNLQSPCKPAPSRWTATNNDRPFTWVNVCLSHHIELIIPRARSSVRALDCARGQFEFFLTSSRNNHAFSSRNVHKGNNQSERFPDNSRVQQVWVRSVILHRRSLNFETENGRVRVRGERSHDSSGK